MVEKCSVHGLPNGFIAAEREGYVADAAGNLCKGKVLLNPAHCLNKIKSVVVMLVDAGCNGQDIWIENNILRGEACLKS